MNEEQEEAKAVDAIIAGQLAVAGAEEVSREYDVRLPTHAEQVVDTILGRESGPIMDIKVTAVKPLAVSVIDVKIVVGDWPPKP